jgi:hypothetical protein
MTFFAGVDVGIVLAYAFLAFALRRWPVQVDNLLEFVRK